MGGETTNRIPRLRFGKTKLTGTLMKQAPRKLNAFARRTMQTVAVALSIATVLLAPVSAHATTGMSDKLSVCTAADYNVFGASALVVIDSGGVFAGSQFNHTGDSAAAYVQAAYTQRGDTVLGTFTVLDPRVMIACGQISANGKIKPLHFVNNVATVKLNATDVVFAGVWFSLVPVAVP